LLRLTRTNVAGGGERAHQAYRALAVKRPISDAALGAMAE